MAGAIFVAAYAFIMSRVPATIFLTASAFPLIPGPNLYYMMYGWVSADSAMAGREIDLLLETCLAIALGFLIGSSCTLKRWSTVWGKRQYSKRI